MKMRKYIYAMVVLLAAVSCQDYRYDTMVSDSFYFSRSGLQEKTLYVMDDQGYTHDMWIHKSGFFQNALAGCVELDYNYLMQYNNTYETEYEMLPEEYCTFERNFAIGEETNECNIPLDLNVNQIVADLGYGTYYIPLTVKSLTPDITPYEDGSHTLLVFDICQACLEIDSEYKGEKTIDLSGELYETCELDITAKLSCEATSDMTVTYTIDETLLPEGGSILGTEYYSFARSVDLVAGEQYADNVLTLRASEVPEGTWVIPVKVGISNNFVKVVDEYVLLTVIKNNNSDDETNVE